MFDKADYMREYRKTHRSRDREKARADWRRWYCKHRKENARRCRAWHLANPQVDRDYQRCRRARIKSLPFDDIQMAVVFNRDGGVCGLCNKPAARDQATLDHIVPISRGGAHVYENVHLAHGRCNSAKGARMDAVIYSI